MSYFPTCLFVCERNKLHILPLLKDYFWDRAQARLSWKQTVYSIAIFARNQLSACESDSEEFVYYSSISYRLLLLAGKESEAHTSSKYYFQGELKNACIRLYHGKEYALSLNICQFMAGYYSQ